MMRDVVIVGAYRTAIGKAPRGYLSRVRPDDLGSHVVKGLVQATPSLREEEIDDCIIGCAFPEGEQGMNIGRIIALKAGLPSSVPAYTVNRFCASGLQSIASGAERIGSGMAEIILAGGVESMSMIPLGGNHLSPNPYLMDHYPEVYMSMGLTAERVAERFSITRQQQDEFALKSHQKAIQAIDEGRFQEEVLPFPVQVQREDEDGFSCEEIVFSTDEGVRRDTTLEALNKLRPVFKKGGSVTAGNSSQTSDGAACLLLMSKEKAEELGLTPLAFFRSFAVAGVDPDVMGIGPVEAIPKVLRQSGLELSDIDVIELNEAFAAQSLAVIKELGLDQEIVNVNGGAIALGHPLGCTGTKLTVTLLHEMMRREVRYGLVSMCIGGGMGAAGIIERAY